MCPSKQRVQWGVTHTYIHKRKYMESGHREAEIIQGQKRIEVAFSYDE
jgi:hypothetical protein